MKKEFAPRLEDYKWLVKANLLNTQSLFNHHKWIFRLANAREGGRGVIWQDKEKIPIVFRIKKNKNSPLYKIMRVSHLLLPYKPFLHTNIFNIYVKLMDIMDVQ